MAKINPRRSRNPRNRKQQTNRMTRGVKRMMRGKARKETKYPVVIIKNVPHGFYEKQMRGYFSQFGEVKRVKVSLNMKTGKKLNRGAVEFADSEVAKVAAEAMDNYLMFGKLMKCKLILPEEIKSNVFKDRVREFQEKRAEKQVRSVTKDHHLEFVVSVKRQIARSINELRKLGIDFKFDCPVRF